MRLYAIRHGQSMANVSRRHSGWQDTPLSPKGEEDARGTGVLLRDIPIDKAYSSDLTRAIRTQQIARPDLTAEQTVLLREMNVGDLAGLSIPESAEKYGELYHESRRKLDFTPFGGESTQDIRGRIQKFITMLEQSPYENVAAFCHAGAVRNMLDIVIGDTVSGKFECANGSVSVFEYKDGIWRVVSWNRTHAD